MSKNKLMILPLLMLGIISLVLGPATNLSFATTGDTIFIGKIESPDSSKAENNVRDMVLKATNENGETIKNPDFELTINNVVNINQNDKVRVWDSPDSYTFTKAFITDVNDNRKNIEITDDGIIDFSGYAVGVYTLDVIVDDKRAYAAIIVIGDQPTTEIEKVIRKETTRVTVDIDVDFDCGKGFFENKNGECIKKRDKPSICYFNPDHKDCEPVDGQCPPGFGFNDNDKCIPHGKCPDGYGRGEDDETGTCYKENKLQKCDDGSVRIPGDTCPPVKPVVDECQDGYTLINGVCQLADTNPVCPPECAGLAPPDCEGTYNPGSGICEDLSIPEEPPTQSELITPPEPIETVNPPVLAEEDTEESEEQDEEEVEEEPEEEPETEESEDESEESE